MHRSFLVVAHVLDFHYFQGNCISRAMQFCLAKGRKLLWQCPDVNNPGIMYLSANKYVEHKLWAKLYCILYILFPCLVGQHLRSLLLA